MPYCNVIHIFVFICLFRSISSDLVVCTTSGPVRGTSSLAEDVEAFLGIPYAEPPVGELRFAKPVPKKQWNSTYDASSLPPPCPQLSLGPYYFLPNISNMSEDCLYLNMWVPKSNSTRGLRPVIIYIHHGGFVTGSSNAKGQDGSNFASRGDVIIVTLNYRLGALGYLLSYTEEAEGNMGMYDQIMAMRWVKENAKSFGGNPENIVLMGSSAGACAVSAHMLSPLSKHLFRRAIIQSAGAMHPMFMDNNTKLYENSQSLAFLVGCANDTTTLKSDPHSVMKCLMNTPEEDIVKAEKEILLRNSWAFFPRVNDAFLPKSTFNLIRKGKFRKDVDVMTGVTDEEGAVLMVMMMQDYFGHYGREDEITINKRRAFALSKGILLTMKEENSTSIANYYLNRVTNHTTYGYLKMLADIFGDYLVSCSTMYFADFLSLKGNTVYFYKFGFRAASTPMAEWVGTSHLDELQYVFGSPYHQNFTAEETELSHRLIDRWSTFARSGNPNLPGQMPWLRYSYHNPLYLNFGQEEESIRMNPNRRCELWRSRYNADLDTGFIRFLRNSGMNTML